VAGAAAQGAAAVVRLRRLAVGLACAVALAGALLLGAWDWAWARGFLLGAGAGVLPFWLFGRRLERSLQAPGEVFVPDAPGWTLLRIGLAIAALLQGHWLTPGSPAGLLSALGGLFLLRGVLLALALGRWDLRAGGR